MEMAHQQNLNVMQQNKNQQQQGQTQEQKTEPEAQTDHWRLQDSEQAADAMTRSPTRIANGTEPRAYPVGLQPERVGPCDMGQNDTRSTGRN